MRKAAGKRLPHGVTAVLVLDALRRLHSQAGQKPVSRAALLGAVPLPETTVDDRLRVLVARGEVVKMGSRGRYRYAPAQEVATGISITPANPATPPEAKPPAPLPATPLPITPSAMPPPAKPATPPEATLPTPPQKKPRKRSGAAFQNYTLTPVEAEGVGGPPSAIVDGTPYWSRR